MAQGSTPYVPWREAIADRKTGMIPRQWEAWFRLQWTQMQQSCAVVGTVALTAQGAAIASTPIPAQTASAGLMILPVLSVPALGYKVAHQVKVRRAASVSSSVALSVTWTQDGVAMTRTRVALTGNTTAAEDSIVWLINPDAGTGVNYQTAYASVGGTSMLYDLIVSLEVVPAVTQS